MFDTIIFLAFSQRFSISIRKNHKNDLPGIYLQRSNNIYNIM